MLFVCQPDLQFRSPEVRAHGNLDPLRTPEQMRYLVRLTVRRSQSTSGVGTRTLWMAAGRGRAALDMQ